MGSATLDHPSRVVVIRGRIGPKHVVGQTFAQPSKKFVGDRIQHMAFRACLGN